MQKEIKTKYYVFLVILCALFFVCGYKYGDSMGYEDGYNEGYRYDCKEEIGLLYKQVKANSIALDYTDSTIKRVYRENDSLKNKELYQKRFERKLQYEKKFAKDSVKYAKYVKIYNDSLMRVVEPHLSNIVRPDGSANDMACLFFDLKIRECEYGWHISSSIKTSKKSSKIKKKGEK